MLKKFSVVMNASARQGETLASSVTERWGNEASEIFLSNDLSTFDSAIVRAKENHVDTLIIGGGDGTIRRASRLLVGCDIELGILPLGTGNALARELGVPMGLLQAMDFYESEAIPAKIDVGSFNKELFVNIATIGITSRVMESISESPKGKFGRLVYFPALLKAVRFSKSFPIRIEVDREIMEEKAIQFVAASSQTHGGPFAVTKDASICDGKLSIYLVKKGERSSLLRYGLGLLFGKHTDLPQVWSADVAEARVTLSKVGKFVLDGDPILTRVVDMRIDRRKLVVLASPESQAALCGNQ